MTLQQQFDRRIQVDIGKIGALVGLRVEGLRVTFDVRKDLTTSTNRARVTIYNLSAKTRGQFKELGDHLWLRAGYRDTDLAQLFEGDVVTISHEREGADLATKIEANDGQQAMILTFANLSYVEGTKVSQVLADVVKAMGLPSKPADPAALFQDQEFLQGFSYAGPARKALDKVTARAGLEWSIQDNQIKLLKQGSHDGTPDAQIPFLTPDSGLVGSPSRLSQLNDQQADKRPPGWKVVSLLQPRLVPGGRIAVRSREIPRPTAFKVETVAHEGDTHGPQWTTTCEAVEPGELLNLQTIPANLA